MPLPVQLLAMSHSTNRNISGFIKTKGKTHFTLSDSQNAQVVILDIDNQEGRDYLLSFESKRNPASASQPPEIQLITLSLSPLDSIDSSIIQIQKPITSIELIRAAEKIYKTRETAKSAISPRKSIATPKNKDSDKADKSLSYDPNETLQGMLRKAIILSDKKNTSSLLNVQDYSIEVNASDNTAYLNFPKNRLRNLCYIPLNSSTCQIKVGTLNESIREKISVPITELAWNTAILCSKGRSPKNINDGLQYQLKRWPNLTRWTVPNNALNIASLWTKSSYSISSIAEQLCIPITDVRCFITAAIDSNLAVVSEEALTSIPYKAKTENSTLFKKLLKRLKRDS